MTNSEFIEGLIDGTIPGLPHMQSFHSFTLTPETVLVFRVKGPLTLKGALNAQEQFQNRFPNNVVIILDESVEMLGWK